MPIFEYVCRACHYHFEVIVTGSQKARCPKCESRKLEQQISSFGVSSNTGYSYTAGSFGRVDTGSAHSRTITARKRS